jgi:hypothetical protein
VDDTQVEPLIYTTKGNLPVSRLVHQVAWEFAPDGSYSVCKPAYYLDGELVRQDVHVWVRDGLPMGTAQGNFGG